MIALRCLFVSAVLSLVACATTPKGADAKTPTESEDSQNVVLQPQRPSEPPTVPIEQQTSVEQKDELQTAGADTVSNSDAEDAFESADSFDDEFAAAEPRADSLQSRDKFEPFNRAMFSFNMKLDRWLLKPVAQGYQWLAPAPVETGVSNFFHNLLEIRNVLNDILQWKWKQAGNDTGRFLLNTTVGIAGIFDVARHAGLERAEGEDFGQTLAVWGLPQGPYLMLPFLGPYTVTSAAGFPVDWVSHPVRYVDSQTVAWSLVAVNQIQGRAQLLESEKLATGDMYIFIRDAYLQRRDFLVNDGAVVDDFGGDFGEENEAFDF